MQITPGRIVHYALTEADAQAINKRREDFLNYLDKGGPDTGHQAHWGPEAAAYDILPAICIKAWPDNRANLQVFLDGNDTLYVAGVDELNAEHEHLGGTWAYPPRG